MDETTTTGNGTEIALILTGTLPQITGNFEACKAFYTAELARYDVVVDPENLPAAKNDLAKLRAEMKRLDRIRIDEASRLKAPITAMEAQVKELTGLIETTVTKIAAQVKACEEKTKARCKDLMLETLALEYQKAEVRSEYQAEGYASVDGMVTLSSVTAAGNLTKAAYNSIVALATAARGLQDRTDGRIARLESDCYAAGLHTPLQRAHIEKFLHDSDAIYKSGLDAIIKIEVSRQEAAQKKLQEEADRKARAKVEEEQRLAKVKADAEAKEAKAKLDREAEEKRLAEKAKWDAEREKAEIGLAPGMVIRPVAGTSAAIETNLPVQEEEKPLPPPPPPPPAGTKVPVLVMVKIHINAKVPVNTGKIYDYFKARMDQAGITDPYSIVIATEQN
jgi:hypothetical protein